MGCGYSDCRVPRRVPAANYSLEGRLSWGLAPLSNRLSRKALESEWLGIPCRGTSPHGLSGGGASSLSGFHHVRYPRSAHAVGSQLTTAVSAISGRGDREALQLLPRLRRQHRAVFRERPAGA